MATQPLVALEDAVRELCAQVRSYGWCTDERIERIYHFERAQECVRVVFYMQDRTQRLHELWLDEFRMQEGQELRVFADWRRNVILDLEAHHAPIASQIERQRVMQQTLMQQQMMAYQSQLGMQNYANQQLGQYTNQLNPIAQQTAYQNLAGLQWAQQERADPKIDERAKELFMSAAGKDAYDTLNAGKALSLTGSEGGKYTLHRRSSFCVERVKDGARLCALVPGVPLWDHLLGIKLMIEHDEKRFLKTANVSQGYAAAPSRGMASGLGAMASGIGGAIGGFFS